MATHSQMPRPKGENDSQVTIVLPGRWLDEAQRLANERSQPGMTITRSDVLRIALRQGLEAMGAQLTPTEKPPRKR
jgi:hypothetical protein